MHKYNLRNMTKAELLAIISNIPEAVEMLMESNEHLMDWLETINGAFNELESRCENFVNARIRKVYEDLYDAGVIEMVPEHLDDWEMLGDEHQEIEFNFESEDPGFNVDGADSEKLYTIDEILDQLNGGGNKE